MVHFYQLSLATKYINDVIFKVIHKFYQNELSLLGALYICVRVIIA